MSMNEPEKVLYNIGMISVGARAANVRKQLDAFIVSLAKTRQVDWSALRFCRDTLVELLAQAEAAEKGELSI